MCAIGLPTGRRGAIPESDKWKQPAERIRHAVKPFEDSVESSASTTGCRFRRDPQVGLGQNQAVAEGEFLPQHDAPVPNRERHATLRMKCAIPIPIPSLRSDLGGSFSEGCRFRCRKAGQEPRAAPSLVCPWASRLRNITWFWRIIPTAFIARPRCGSAPRSPRLPGSACTT